MISDASTTNLQIIAIFVGHIISFFPQCYSIQENIHLQMGFLSCPPENSLKVDVWTAVHLQERAINNEHYLGHFLTLEMGNNVCIFTFASVQVSGLM